MSRLRSQRMISPLRYEMPLAWVIVRTTRRTWLHDASRKVRWLPCPPPHQRHAEANDGVLPGAVQNSLDPLMISAYHGQIAFAHLGQDRHRRHPLGILHGEFACP